MHPAHASPAKTPQKQHVLVDYIMNGDSVNLEKTAENTYRLTFKYKSPTGLICSVLTFVEESFNVQTNTTEKLEADKAKGSEKHAHLEKCTDEKLATIDGLKIVAKEKYNFGDQLLNNYYPLIIRLVSCLTLPIGK